MRTRKALYATEAQEIVRTLTLYKTLACEQIYRIFPGREKNVKNLLTVLIKQGRIFYDSERGLLSGSSECMTSPDTGTIASFWVLLDFIDRAEYHTASDFPVNISFFSEGELYEIIYVAYGQELLVEHALSEKDDTRRIIVVESRKQIEQLAIPGVSGYCTVSPEGKISYYKLE